MKMGKNHTNHKYSTQLHLLAWQDGFSLIELLIVISTIALLMGILLPALGKAREAARSSICMANVRRISMAGYIYVLQNDGMFPPFRMMKLGPTAPADYVNKYGRVKPRWPWFFDHGIGPVIDPSPYITSPGDTFSDSDTLIMTNDYFMCPSWPHGDFDKCDIRNGSYGYNYQYLGNSRITGDKFHNFPVRLGKIRRPSETVIIADSRGARGESGAPSIPHGLHSYTLDPPKIARSTGAVNFAWHSRPEHWMQHSPAEARHMGKACVSFVDGHTEKLSLEEMGYVLDADGLLWPTMAAIVCGAAPATTNHKPVELTPLLNFSVSGIKLKRWWFSYADFSRKGYCVFLSFVSFLPLFELLRTAEHPQFKQIAKLIK